MTKLIQTLVVDDEDRIRLVLSKTLQQVGHVVTEAASGEEALDVLQDTVFDVVLLDLMLGGRADGQRVLEAIRWRWPGTVVIMMTGHASLESAVQAIQEGVDGYLLKPVKPEEVRRAVNEALQRRKKLLDARGGEPGRALLKRGPFTIDLTRQTATYKDQPLDIPIRELKLLAHLMQNAPSVVSAKELVTVVRGYSPKHAYEARDIIKWYIYRLRQEIEPDPSSPRYILNVRGVGYRFEE
jgi:DNA-binding response OmpR family regulator